MSYSLKVNWGLVLCKEMNKNTCPAVLDAKHSHQGRAVVVLSCPSFSPGCYRGVHSHTPQGSAPCNSDRISLPSTTGLPGYPCLCQCWLHFRARLSTSCNAAPTASLASFPGLPDELLFRGECVDFQNHKNKQLNSADDVKHWSRYLQKSVVLLPELLTVHKILKNCPSPLPHWRCILLVIRLQATCLVNLRVNPSNG
jgi:hypothetical protein